MKRLLVAAGLGLAALVALLILAAIILPLRVVSEYSYVAKDQLIPIGSVSAEVNGTYRRMPIRYWYDGYRVSQPYRVRVFFRPESKVIQSVTFSGKLIDENHLGVVTLPERQNDRPDNDRNGEKVFIAGYLDLDLQADRIPLDLTIEAEGKIYPVRLELDRTSTTRLIHSTLEAIMGI